MEKVNMKNETREDLAKKLQYLIDIQGTDGTWNYSRYHHGMLNGMIFCKSVIDNKDPQYKEKPEDGFINENDARKTGIGVVITSITCSLILGFSIGIWVS